ncbi:hypothetical protein [Mycobacteroides chelonae]|uniref:P-type ATPase n=1 Tax=Mycobacteroides chelonae TaxID=1774 RepID=UPI0009BCCBC7
MSRSWHGRVFSPKPGPVRSRKRAVRWPLWRQEPRCAYQDGDELKALLGELNKEQRFVVRLGESTAADGVVFENSAAIDMSAMTGQTQPVPAEPGVAEVGGTVVLDGRRVVEDRGPGARIASHQCSFHRLYLVGASGLSAGGWSQPKDQPGS